MNVKVSYTTKFDDIPYDCWRLLDYKIHDALEFLEPLKELHTMLANGDNLNSLEALEKIHKLRLILADYDACLNDINSILTEWNKYRLQSYGNHDKVNTTEQDSSGQQTV